MGSIAVIVVFVFLMHFFKKKCSLYLFFKYVIILYKKRCCPINQNLFTFSRIVDIFNLDSNNFISKNVSVSC